LAANLTGLLAKRADLGRSVLLVTPETVLRWHRELVRRKWAIARRRVAERPPLAGDLEALILRRAAENGRWGYSRIHGELRKLVACQEPSELCCCPDSQRAVRFG
jgi:hypothetical protein